MRIIFLADWRVYRKGQIVDWQAVGLSRGAVVELANRGIVKHESESVAGYEAMVAKPVQTMTKQRKRPPGGKTQSEVR